MAEARRVKICGVTHVDDARAADGAGADYVGFILSAGFGRSVEPALARRAGAGLNAVPVGVLVDESAEDAARLAEAAGVHVLQLHGTESPELAGWLRQRGWGVWKSVRARVPADVSDVVARFGEVADGILVEGFKEGVVGGGGAGLDLSFADAVRAAIPPSVTFVLAGGLTPALVAEAAARFRPDAVDVSSGVEVVRGRKDPDLVRRFIENARGSLVARHPRGGGERGP